VNGEGSAAGCPCDANAACNTSAAERVWTNFISPSLLLFAMCIHGIFEGMVLGIQVSFISDNPLCPSPDNGPLKASKDHGCCVSAKMIRSHDQKHVQPSSQLIVPPCEIAACLHV
jgi:hypothetical protein